MLLTDLFRDIRYSLRQLARTPGATTVAILTLALGIGANTAIFSIVNGVLLRPLPYPNPDRVFLIQHSILADSTQSSMPPGNFYDLKQQSRLMQPMGAFSGANVTLSGRGEPERLPGIEVLGGALEVLGVRPALGRLIAESDEAPGAPKAVVISHNLWQRLFAGSPDAIGQTLTLGGAAHTIVGVMPKGFNFPDSNIDIWGPGQLSAKERASRTEFYLTLIGRLADGASPDAARAELDAIMARMRNEFPQSNSTLGISAQPLRDALVANVSQLLWIMMGSVGCVLLVACANLANLLLAKATGRAREVAIRQAIGAGRGRLVRQFLVESIVLSAIGGAAGMAAGTLFLRALVAWLPAGIPRIAEATVDGRVLLFTFAASVATGVLFGLAPATQAMRSAAPSALRDDSRTASGRSRVRAILVAAEMALAVVLLAGAGLLIRSFALLQRVDPGFKTDKVLTFQLRMDSAAYATGQARIAFVNDIVDRLRALPGVESSAANSYAPVTGRGTGAWFNIVSRPWPAGTTPPGIPYRVITPDYFATMQIPLLRGRLLTAADGLRGTPSVVISESLAKRFWGSATGLPRRSGEAAEAGDALGSDIYLGAPDYKLFDRATIVGIVKDVKLAGLGSNLTDAVYGLNTLMPWWRNFTFTVRTAGDPASIAPEVRQIVRSVDPAMPVIGLQAMTDIMRTSIAPTRASMLLLTLFAGVALVMAAVGVFGVMSYTVSRRVREMGIRLALGARPGEVTRMVIRDGLTQALAGIAAGVAGAYWLTRVMESMLFIVKPGDPLTLAAAAVTLLATAALACYIPARRATRVDPLVILRTE